MAQDTSARKTGRARTRSFQAEVRQLLKLMIHSLYSHKEIFLRELISNASDACDRLRFEAISHPELLADDTDLAIAVDFDAEEGWVEVSDNGIGMSEDEVIQQLGTIAKSGTSDFLAGLSGDEQEDARLIGQFGVGFYSSFIVASRVEVRTRRAGLDAGEGVSWSSEGQGKFTVRAVPRERRGTSVRLYLKEEEKGFAEPYHLRSLIQRYSDHIAFPVTMPGTAADGDEDKAAPEPSREVVNTAQALWTRPKRDIKPEEYQEFYRHIARDSEDALCHAHNQVEGRREYASLLFVPRRAPFDLFNRESPRGVKLYVQRVFIMDDAEQFLPLYLRFIRGVVDSRDLPLNVSRELLQQNDDVRAMRQALARRVLDMLDRLAGDDADNYQVFWDEFGRVFKEGVVEDPVNRDRILTLLRFASTSSDDDRQTETLEDYAGRKPDDQKEIYYIAAAGPAAARSSPQLEVFTQRGLEVLLLSDPIDEWVVGHLGEHEGLRFRDITRGALAADELPGTAPVETADSIESEDADALLKRMKSVLGDEVSDVRSTSRLTDSPSCLALGEHEMGVQMQRILRATGQELPETKPILEINTGHGLFKRLALREGDAELFEDLTRLLQEQAVLTQGRELDNPGEFVRRVNRLLES
ncbi:MAG: molecular chaperone HtpG [Gammaproteobacteria bacterium]|nr:molecular chaperone HtpG [Gammaproteobacteria bacterium]MXW45979.1 molecular chaperone HtpG [Gammaproteobacteria bacterium]MYD02458.1 molecular chaperone HtpG [Gammaproteobacteria bacterium]MYI25944.1 molecular chaperone HtpG [Gammaproteobacteria bacterium]